MSAVLTFKNDKYESVEKVGMGIHVEFNPDLALRDISEFHAGRRKIEECIPEPLVEGREYLFLKKGQRNYWLHGEFPLIETKGGDFSVPKASVVMLEVTHVLEDGEVWTKGRYRVVRVLREGEVYFNGFGTIVGRTDSIRHINQCVVSTEAAPSGEISDRSPEVSRLLDPLPPTADPPQADEMTQVVKPLKFAEHLVPLVLSGEKTSTWRLFDDKDLWVDDLLSCIDRSTGNEFARARITSVQEKALGDISESDFDGHEQFPNPSEMYAAYRGYYGDRVSPASVVKIIAFEIVR